MTAFLITLLMVVVSFLLVFILGGMFILGAKIYSWYDDRNVDAKIGGWFAKQDYMFVQLFPPALNERSMAEMENFYINLASIFSSKSKKDIYVEGKWYENFTIEVHSRGGQVNFFMYFNRNYLPLLRSALASHYPGAGIVECPDPLSNWPKDWTGKVGPYTDMFGADLEYAKSDLHPTKSWKLFQMGTNTPTTDPVTTLITGLENIESEDYAILQFVISPRAIDDDKRKKWKSEFEKLRTEFTNNSVVEVTETGQTRTITRQEKTILEAAQDKMVADNYLTKIRVLLLSSKPGPARMLGPIMSYFKQYSFEPQFIKPNGDTKTSAASESAMFGKWEDEWYWKPEQNHRKKRIYKAVLDRSLVKGCDPKLIDVESLAALFHFPVTTLAEQSLLSRMTTNYGDPGSAGALGQAPSNLPM